MGDPKGHALGLADSVTSDPRVRDGSRTIRLTKAGVLETKGLPAVAAFKF